MDQHDFILKPPDLVKYLY